MSDGSNPRRDDGADEHTPTDGGPSRSGRRPAVFVDRDGTLCRHVPYLDEPSEVEPLPTVATGVRRLNETGVPVVIVTNQSGVGRGYFSERTLHRVNARLLADLAGQGARVTDCYYCPHHPDAGCDCRKPAAGLIETAAADHGLDPRASYVIGDRASDVTAGRRADCTTVWFPSAETDDDADPNPDHTVETFREAVRIVRRDLSEPVTPADEERSADVTGR